MTADGPLIDVLVGVITSQARTLLAQGQPVPPPLQVRGLIDTGANRSAIDLGCISALGLPIAGSATFFTPSSFGGPQHFDLYDVSLTLLHANMSFTLNSVFVVAAPLAQQGFEVLLGRDVLKHCLLVYDGLAGSYTLAF